MVAKANESEKFARERALEVLDECQISTVPVEPAEIAEARSSLLYDDNVDLKGHAYGAFLYRQGTFLILVAADCHTREQRRFSFAHELGHFHLPHLEILAADQRLHLTKDFASYEDEIEAEANFFASELLMPIWAVNDIAAQSTEGLPSVKSISRTCETSLLSSAIRYAKTSDAPTAVVMSDGSDVSFSVLSASLWRRGSFRRSRPKKGTRVPVPSPTSGLAAAKVGIATCDERNDVVEASSWFPAAPREYHFREQARGLGKFGKVLTVLTAA